MSGMTNEAATPERFGYETVLCRLKLRINRRAQRAGWNGAGMYVIFQAGYPDGIPINKNTAEATGLPEGTVCKFGPYMMLRAADGTFVPWVPSQTDQLATDWTFLD